MTKSDIHAETRPITHYHVQKKDDFDVGSNELMIIIVKIGYLKHNYYTNPVSSFSAIKVGFSGELRRRACNATQRD